MGKKTDFRPNRVREIPSGEPFVMHSRELIASEAWRTRPIHVVRLMDRLEIEHLAHGGTENGNLLLTYDQMVEAGIGRQYCNDAIKEAERRGLVEAKRASYCGAARTAPTRFGITYLKARVEGFDRSP